MNDIDEHRIGWIETHLRSHALEVRFGWIETSDASDAWNPFGRIRCCVGAQRVSDQVNIFRSQVVLLLQFLDQKSDFQTN